jgi:hypothetical protein
MLAVCVLPGRVVKMAPELNFEEVGVPEIVQGITAILLAPIVLPVAAGVKQPLVKEVIKGGIALSERCKEAFAEVEEVFEDLIAETKAEMAEQRQAEPNPGTKTYTKVGESEAVLGINNVTSTLNEQIGQITNGVVDLRLLVPVGLGALALRQLLDKGLEIEEIPWYTLAWYAFDSFLKLNNRDES